MIAITQCNREGYQVAEWLSTQPNCVVALISIRPVRASPAELSLRFVSSLNIALMLTILAIR